MSIRVLVLGTLALFLVACGGDDGGQGQTGSTRCDVGEKRACACTDGGSGFKSCKDDEHWGSCVCDGSPADDVAGGDDAIVGHDAGTDGDDSATPPDSSCVRDCNGKQCGPDSCGGVCGTCPDGLTCGPGYQCQTGACVPACAGKQCGPDGCNGSCGACDGDATCDAAGQCVDDCVPDCSELECGSDGCGGSCGSCPSGTQCDAGTCESTCQPNCAGKVCGDNGCGGSCGSCASGKSCQSGQCVSTTQIDCLQLYEDCLPTCNGDQTCAEACYGTLSPTGKSETDAFMICLQDAGCYDDADFNQCMVSACFSEYLGCFHGDQSCPQVASCLDGCGSSASACWGDCLAEGTASVQVDYYEQADQCLVDQCCPTDVATCSTTDGTACIEEMMGPFGSCSWPALPCP